MSTSYYVEGFAPPNEQWTKMKAIWDACKAAKVEVPVVVDNFFDGEDPDAAGVKIEISTHTWCNGWRNGYEINVADIPKHVTTIRFVIS